jgi:putative ABC transport system permease protein
VTYYQEYRFPEGFATVTRAPEHVSERLREVPGINEVHTRVTAGANLEVEGFGEPIRAAIHSLPEDGQPALNRLYLREGRLLEPGREEEVLLSEQFAMAHGLRPGDEITAIIRGRRRALTIAGIVLTPEHLWQVEPGSIFPDPETYGVLWMGRAALAAAFDMEGAFNDVAFTLAPGASLEDVIERVDLVLERYGGLGAFGRDTHPSHMLLRMELDQLQGMAALLPVIFLAVAAFLLNIVVMRLIALQREQIAVLKAFGYRDRDVGAHYVKLVLLIALLGTALGRSPRGVAGAGAGGPVPRVLPVPCARVHPQRPRHRDGHRAHDGRLTPRRTAGGAPGDPLPPAEAMRPAPPASFRPTIVERLGLQRMLNQPTRIILRNIERQPLKAAFTVLGIAISGALLIMGLFFNDAFDHVIEVQYGIAQREDVTVGFIEPASTAALHEIRSLPGVLHAEPFRAIPVRLRHGHRSYQTAIEGIPHNAYLRRVIDDRLRSVPIPRDGVILAEGLAGSSRPPRGTSSPWRCSRGASGPAACRSSG